METFIQSVQDAGVQARALAVTGFGLAGVFATLLAFFAIIWIADKTQGKGRQG